MRNNAYLILAVLGTIIPVVLFAQYFAPHGLDLGGFLAAAFANPVASGLSADLVISSVVFWVWMFSHRDGPNPVPFIVMNLLVGLSLALPLYLWLRGRRPAAAAAATG